MSEGPGPHACSFIHPSLSPSCAWPQAGCVRHREPCPSDALRLGTNSVTLDKSVKSLSFSSPLCNSRGGIRSCHVSTGSMIGGKITLMKCFLSLASMINRVWVLFSSQSSCTSPTSFEHHCTCDLATYAWPVIPEYDTYPPACRPLALQTPSTWHPPSPLPFFPYLCADPLSSLGLPGFLVFSG